MDDKQKHYLIIWEEIPEDTFLYLIPEDVLSDEHKRLIKDAHNHFINSEESEGAYFLNHAFGNPCDLNEENYYDNKLNLVPNMSQYNGIFQQYKQEGAKPLENIYITNVYVSGFIL